MNLDAIVQSIDDEIDRLQRLRALLTGHTAPLKCGFPSSEQDQLRKHRIRAEGRATIAAAQKKRAKPKRAPEPPTPEPAKLRPRNIGHSARV